MTLQPNTFAKACYEPNTLADLKEALANYPDGDRLDMAQWNLASAGEWRDQIKLAIAALKADGEK